MNKNKQDLVEVIASAMNAPASSAEAGLNAVLEFVMHTVKEGGQVTVVGFGNWKRAERKARDGRNPKTGETLHIKASKVPKFTAGKKFKDMVNS